ncbi:hypothetical protein GCM10011498_03260 [Amylibacter cionae]|uniref:Uncharacterized protein n=1 Tax=Neptunicoccus cionae TaxID=2035344 RepID=A0A916QS17_9RHOB|nr:hypothetical protein GCM10011498_03260 [Amylibacter cionae]
MAPVQPQHISVAYTEINNFIDVTGFAEDKLVTTLPAAKNIRASIATNYIVATKAGQNVLPSPPIK